MIQKLRPQHDVKLPRPRPNVSPGSVSFSASGLTPSAIDRPGWSISSCDASGTPAHTNVRSSPISPRKTNPYPSRPILRPSIQARVPFATLESWADSVGLVLGPLVPGEEARHKVLSLLYHYRHLNGTTLKNLPCTDIITHRVRIKPNTKPTSHITLG